MLRPFSCVSGREDRGCQQGVSGLGNDGAPGDEAPCNGSTRKVRRSDLHAPPSVRVVVLPEVEEPAMADASGNDRRAVLTMRGFTGVEAGMKKCRVISGRGGTVMGYLLKVSGEEVRRPLTGYAVTN